MKWISVEERLPEKDGRVLVLRTTEHWVDIGCYYKQDRWSSGFYSDGEMDTNVTHWMPLPSPALSPSFQSACSECDGDGCAKCCHGCAQRDEHIVKLERSITSAIDTIPSSMGGNVTLGLNILQAVQRDFQMDE